MIKLRAMTVKLRSNVRYFLADSSKGEPVWLRGCGPGTAPGHGRAGSKANQQLCLCTPNDTEDLRSLEENDITDKTSQLQLQHQLQLHIGAGSWVRTVAKVYEFTY